MRFLFVAFVCLYALGVASGAGIWAATSSPVKVEFTHPKDWATGEPLFVCLRDGAADGAPTDKLTCVEYTRFSASLEQMESKGRTDL